MKHIKALILSLVISLLSLPSWADTDDKYLDVISNGLIVWNFNKKPFTGTVKGGMRGRVEKGIQEGYWEIEFDNGKLGFKGNYKGGKQDGSWEHYYESGMLRLVVTYKNGEPHGPYLSYKEDGTLVRTAIFKDGVDITKSIIEDEEIGNKEITVPDFTK